MCGKIQTVRLGFMGESVSVYEEYPCNLDFDDGLPLEKRSELFKETIRKTLGDGYENTQTWKDIKEKVRIC